MRDPLKRYPYKEDTWRWGIPEPPKRSGWWIVAAIAALAIAIALLLAGCREPAPRPTPEPTPLGNASQSTTTVNPLPVTDGSYYDISGTSSLHVATKDRPIAKFHYEGGSWCNVWADDKGIHWEECK